MTRKHHLFFIIIVICLLSLPIGYFCGLQETTKIHGVEIITELPSLQTSSFSNKIFQNQFENYWSSHFLFRKAALKAKNQLYDWFNFNQIHSGYNGLIIEGKDDYLFEKMYFDALRSPCLPVPTELEKLAELKQRFNQKGIELYFILAPNKAVTYSEKLPNRYRFFLNDTCRYDKLLTKTIAATGIPVYNAQKLMHHIKNNEKMPVFPKTGTHWNLYAAGRTLQETAELFKWPTVELTQLEQSKKPYFVDEDLAQLLNLYDRFESREIYIKPVLKASHKLNGTTTLIGNSFLHEYRYVLIESQISSTSLLPYYENPPLTPENIEAIWQSKRVVLIYTDIALIQKNDQFYQKLETLLNALKQENIFLFQDQKTEQRLKLTGLSFPENWGRWSDGKEVTMTFDTHNKVKDLILNIEGFALLHEKMPSQQITVYVQDKPLTKWLFQLNQPMPVLRLHIPKEKFGPDGKTVLKFIIDHPVVPKEIGLNEDFRQLGFAFIRLSIDD